MRIFFTATFLFLSILATQAQDKYGVMDSTLQWTVPPVYDKIITPDKETIVSADFMIAVKDDKVGVIDAHNNVVIPFEYKAYGWNRNDTIELKDENNKWGVIGSGTVIIPFEYDAIDYYSRGNRPCIVGKRDERGGRKYGCIDKYTFEVILPPIYHEVRMGEYIMLANKERGSDNYAVFDYSGKQLTPFEYSFWTDSYYTFPGSWVIRAKMKDKNPGQKAMLEFPYNLSAILLDMDGNPLTEVYDGIYYMNYNGQGYKMFHVVKDGKQGILDSLAQIAIPCEYDNMELYSFSNNRLPARKNGNWGVIDIHNREAVPFIYDSIIFIDDHSFCVQQNDEWSLIDFDGKKLLKETYEGIKKSKQGNFAVQENGKWGIIDSKGSFVIPALYDRAPYANYFESGDTLEIEKDRKKGLIDKTGRILVPALYDGIYGYGENGNYYHARIDSKYGMLDLNHKQVLPFEYEEIIPTHDQSVFIVSKDNAYALINISGKQITDFQYVYIWPQAGSGLFLAGLPYGYGYGVKDGLINKKGEVILPFDYAIWPLNYDNRYMIVRTPTENK